MIDEKKYYHTQECRFKKLTSPIICTREDAWLGDAFYFWYEESDAVFWGNTFKRKTGKYDIYSANIDHEDVLDTVFNELHYNAWVTEIEKMSKNFQKKTGIKPTLKEINDYFKMKGVWDGVKGIKFQDISSNPIHFMVDKFQYKKRIQLAVYDDEIISNFVLSYEGDVV